MAGATVPELDRTQLYELVITLLDAGVDIDRRVLVLDGASLADLHLIIQATMGWENYHLHEFTVRDGTTYGDTSIDDEPTYADESGVVWRTCSVSPATRWTTSTTSVTPGNTASNSSRFAPTWGREPLAWPVSADVGFVRPKIAEASGATAKCARHWPIPRQRGTMNGQSGPDYPCRSIHLAFDLAGANQAVRSLALQGRRTR